MSETKREVAMTEVEFCGCTNEQLESGLTCGQPQCPNAPPVAKPGTIFRFPIVVAGFIELRNLKEVRVVVDPFDWEYAAWPRVSPYGDDKDIAQIDDGPETVAPYERHRRIEADVDIVMPLRALAEFRMDNSTDWRISRGANEGITKHTSTE